MGALDAVLVVAVLVAAGRLTGSAFAIVGEMLGQASVQGPGWLGPAVTTGSIVAAGLIGGRAARRGGDNLSAAAIAGVVWFIAVYVAWVFVWTTWRLGITGEIGSAPFLPVHAALLTFAGLLLPSIAFFLPAALLWAWVVSAVLSGAPTRGRAGS